MAKKETHFLRLITTGIIWAVVYLELSAKLCWFAFEFEVLCLNDWGKRIGDFLNNRWTVETGKDWGLFLFMLGFIPIFFIGWRLVYRFHWGKLFPKRKTVIKPVRPIASESIHKGFNPTKLRVQTSALLSVPLSAAQAPGEQSQVPSQSFGAPPIPDITGQPSQPKFEDEKEVQQMLAMTANIKADFFPHVMINGAYASFAMSTEKLAIVVKIINRPESTFAVDTEVDVEQSDWFYESGLISAPAKDIITIAKNLQDNEPNSIATPVIVLMGGSLLNIEETLNFFEKTNVVLLRTENVEGDEIPLMMDFLTEYFGTRS